MDQADRVHSTPPLNSSLPRRLSERELDPKDVLVDLFEEELHPDPEHLAKIVIERLRDAGFEIRPAEKSATTVRTKGLPVRLLRPCRAYPAG